MTRQPEWVRRAQVRKLPDRDRDRYRLPSRRLTQQHTPVWRQAEPWRPTWRDNVRTVFEIVAGVTVLGGIALAFFLWSWIIAALQVTP